MAAVQIHHSFWGDFRGDYRGDCRGDGLHRCYPAYLVAWKTTPTLTSTASGGQCRLKDGGTKPTVNVGCVC